MPQTQPMTATPSDTAHLREERIGRRSIFEGHVLHVFEDTILLPSGRHGTREVVEHPGAVSIVARAEDGRFLLVRQWRHAVGRALWELVAGTRESGEDPAATAARELSEETGFTAASWRSLGSAFVGPGYSSEEMFFFAADGLHPGEPHTDTDELLDVQFFDHAGLHALIVGGEVDVKTIAGLARSGVSVDG